MKMMNRSSKVVSVALSVLSAFCVSLPGALSNAPPHYFVLPGTCETVDGNNSSVSLVTVNGKPGLRCFSNSPSFPFASSAEIIFESTDPSGNPTGFAIPQGIASLDLVNNTPNVLDVIQILGYYDNGTVILLDTGVETAASGRYSLNTVQNLGALRAIGVRYTAENNGNVTASNFQNNGRPLGINGINHNIGCLPLPVEPTKSVGWKK
jgi:hypothetical protein